MLSMMVIVRATSTNTYRHIFTDFVAWFVFALFAILAAIVCIYNATYAVTSINNNTSNNIPTHQSYLDGQHYDNRRLQDEPKEDEEAESLYVNVTFADIQALAIFIAVAWILSNASVAVGLPTLVGDIICGFLLGPPLADFCPFPQAMVLIGNFGLIGLMLESGIHLDIVQLQETGKRAVFLAVSGTVLALATGLNMAIWNESVVDFSSAMAVGSAFAPSSLGVSATVLSAGHVLNTPTGQLIVASSIVDDVLGLILLSLLNVFVMEAPTALDYVRPFLASFGYLIVLGYAGITLIPQWVERYLLPRVPVRHHEKAVFCVMFGLLIAYLPILNYSGASYLTGAFLAGLSVSQIPLIHTSYARNGRELMVWLMRIFFAATIGFQVPIRKFKEMGVLKWGSKLLVPIVSKLPVGLAVPNFSKTAASQPEAQSQQNQTAPAVVPEDLPFDPYWRDVWITSLSMMCRGEFNFIVASFGLSKGVLGPDLYSAIVFAVLLSSIMCPLILTRVIAYYNKKTQDYLAAPHAVTRINHTSPDGYRPLFVAVQVRTPIQYDLHETLQKALEGMGMRFLDHRSWHTNGRNALEFSEIFAKDTKSMVRIPGCFDVDATTTPDDRHDSKHITLTKDREDDNHDNKTALDTGSESDQFPSLSPVPQDDDDDLSSCRQSSKGGDDHCCAKSVVSNGGTEDPRVVEAISEEGMVNVSLLSTEADINHRIHEIRAVLMDCLHAQQDDARTAIQVTQWQPFLQEHVEQGDEEGQQDQLLQAAATVPRRSPPRRIYTFESNHSVVSETNNAEAEAWHKQPWEYGETKLHPIPTTPTLPFTHSVSRDSSPGDHPQQQPYWVQPNLEQTDLWTTDEVAHTCIRHHELTWNPVVGGHLAEHTDHDDFFLPQHDHDHHGAVVSSSEQEKETTVIQGRLHGYVRRSSSMGDYGT